MVDYEKIWNIFKNMLAVWHNETDDDKTIKEKRIYDDLIKLMEYYEEVYGTIKS